MLDSIINFFNFIFLLYFVLLNSIYFLTTGLAFVSLKKYVRKLKTIDITDLITFSGTPPITLIVPAHNEEKTCIDALNSLLLLKYPEYEIIFVNDGSTDSTLDKLKKAFDLVLTARTPTSSLKTAQVKNMYRSRRYDNFWVIDKIKGGKADALNVGINFCRTPLFCGMDADTVLDRDALMRIVRLFLEDSSTVAVGGIIRIINGCTLNKGVVKDIRMPGNLLAQLQVLEYLRAFLAGRMGWDAMDALLIISGAFGIFRRSTVVEVGGYATNTVGEDMELVVRIHRHCREKKMKYRISFIPDPVAWTECPATIKELSRQRDRWQRGLIETLIKHNTMLFNPEYGRIGMIAFPYFYFLEMLGPIIEIFGYILFIISVILGIASLPYIIAFFLLTLVFGMGISIAAVAMEELSIQRYPKFSDLLRLFALAIIENIGFRQVITFWRFKAIISFVKNKKDW